MKKIVILIVLLMLSASAFASFKDGEYIANEDKYSFWGWKAYVKIIIKDGKVISVDHDYENKKGGKQSQDEKYNKDMFKSKKTDPKTFTAKWSKELLDEQSADKIDTIAGATESHTKFVTLSKLLLEKAQTGETGEYVLKKSKLEKVK